MMVSTGAEDLLPIKCSSCGSELDLVSMASHICALPSTSTSFDFGQSNQSLPSAVQPANNEARRNGSLLKTQRPVLPKLEPPITGRANMFSIEPTSASNVTSPSSSGRRSPWTGSRKTAVRPSLRPPSPELISQDCAFPPFPTSRPRKTTTARDDRYYSSRRENVGEKSWTAHRNNSEPSSARASKLSAGEPNAFSKSRSASGSSRSRDIDTSSLASTPSTASSSRRPSISNNVLGSKVSSNGNVPPLPSPPTFLTEADTVLSESPTSSVRLSASSSKAQSSKTELSPDEHASPSLQQQDPLSNEEALQKVDPTSSELQFSGSIVKPQAGAGKEPTYKSKRPTPLRQITGDLVPAKVRTPTVPTPTSAARFGQSLGRLLSRARSKSAGADRNRFPIDGGEVPAMPSPMSMSFYIPNTPSPTNDGSMPVLEPTRHSDIREPAQMATSDPSQSSTVVATIPSDPRPTSDEAGDHRADSTEMEKQTRQTSETQMDAQDSKRTSSIYSRSSFGSIDLSYGSRSSLSSVPQNTEFSKDLLRAHPVRSTSPELKAAAVDLNVESPTDPMLQQGSFPAIPAVPALKSHEATGYQKPVMPETIESGGLLQRAEAGNKGTCRGCLRMILSYQKSVTSADGRLTGRYHKECFTCWTCHEAFPSYEFYVLDDRPFCAEHYHESNGTLCGTCGKGIEGLYMQTSSNSGKRYHPHCLTCATCSCPLESDYFEYMGRMYCEKDAFRLANLPSKYDTAPAVRSPLVREYISSIEPGLGGRFPERRTTKMMFT